MADHTDGTRGAASARSGVPPSHALERPESTPRGGRTCSPGVSRTEDTPPARTASRLPRPTSRSRAFASSAGISAPAGAVVAVASIRAWLGLRVRVGLDTQIRTPAQPGPARFQLKSPTTNREEPRLRGYGR